MIQVGEAALAEVTKLASDLSKILDELEVRTASNAVTRIGRMKAERDEYIEQVQSICTALNVDNWYNALRKIEKLVGKQD